MACRTCGSDWLTARGKDCNRCPYCDKQQLCQARKQGRWLEPTQIKKCVQCRKQFTAVGFKHIKQRILCESPVCRKQHRNFCKTRRDSGVFVRSRTCVKKKQDRFCKRCGKGPLNRNQKKYCGKTCSGADATEFKRSFKEVSDWFYSWHHEASKIVSCLTCGTLINYLTGQRKFCNNACGYRFKNPLHQLCMDCESELKADTRHVKRCIACKVKRQRACQRACHKTAGNTPRKRCKKYGVPYDLTVKSLAVFKRDNYVCQLCNIKCLKKFTVIANVPHPSSPTVDHIIAISLRIKGHSWDNVQCACWACNVAKGAKAKGQLRFALA